MFKAWNIIDCGLTEKTTGHQYWETKALAEELARRGVETRVLCHNGLKDAGFAGARTLPTFTIAQRKNVSKDPNWSRLENFVVHNRSFCHDLTRLKPPLLRDALAYFPAVTHQQLLGALRWLGRFRDAERPAAVMVLFPLQDWSEETSSASWTKTIWEKCDPKVKRSVVLCVRSAPTAELFQRLLGVRPHVLPSPLRPPDRPLREKIPEPMTVAFVGGARRERGGHLIAPVVRLCASLDVRFFIQAKEGSDPKFNIEWLTKLRSLPTVDLHEGPLEQKAYFDAIERSIVLLPYLPTSSYRWKSSGVYLEAKCLGAPVIVSPGTWMAAEVEASGNGLVIKEFSPSGIAACITQAQKEWDSLRARAAHCALDYRNQHGADRCVDAIMALFSTAASPAPESVS